MKNNKELVILAGRGEGRGSVTPASIVDATGQMTAQQKADTRANIGATDASTSIPDNVKQALLACFADVAWADDQGQAHYDALEAALYPLDHITAVYTQSGTVYDTDSLDSLKTDLVVTAVYEGGNTETVPAADYTLSGTLTVGTSTITVSYRGKTATFDVTVTESNPFADATYERYPWARTSYPPQTADNIYKNSETAARARIVLPLANPNKTFTVTDSTKYNIAVYNVTSLETVEVTIGGKLITTWPGTDNNKSWGVSGSSSAPYVALSFKKMDNTEFTDEELANMYGTVFTMA